VPLKELSFKSLYFVPRDNVVHDVLIRCLKHATSLDCMFGFFGSNALKVIAPGLAEYHVKATQAMRLIISPNLSEADAQALRDGVRTPPEVLEERLVELIGEAKVTANALAQHTLTCLAYLLATNKIEIRIAWLRDGALFHSKAWCFRDDEDTVVVHGSGNLTDPGLWRNHEQIRVDASWYGERALETIKEMEDEFQALWSGSRDYVVAIDLPQAVKKSLLREYEPDRPPTMADFENAWEEDAATLDSLFGVSQTPMQVKQSRLQIPSHLELFSGPFAHQGRALQKWEAAGRRGILAMATGSGKTITALAAATRLQDEGEPLLIIVSAPYKPLVSQWVNEVAEFGVSPLPISGSADKRANDLDLAIRALNGEVSQVEVMIVTENFLTSNKFRRVFDSIPEKVKTLLVADEAHNLGKQSFITNMPERFDYRLGLSATPERQYDPEGTEKLFEFFGQPVFEFSLQEAIGVCLVPYNYYMHQVPLSEDEYEDWEELTEKLRLKSIISDIDPSDAGHMAKGIELLLFARRRIIESAESKVNVLRAILAKRDRDTIKHTLIYATDKNGEQLKDVNDMLQHDLGLTIHEITSRQTSQGTLAPEILKRFSEGDYNAVTCMRVLDEGVDVPQVTEAFLLASNTVRRQWIQRRGRVLRKCDTIGKKIAHLHDFIVVPPNPGDKNARPILKGELDRAVEFAELASNGGEQGGAFEQIEQLMAKMFG